MRFGEQFEYHRIPEWYHMYLNYHALKLQIEIFKNGCESRKPNTLRISIKEGSSATK